MSKEIDLNKVARYEKVIGEKYGKETIQNPKSSWNKEKEKTFLQDLKTFYSYDKRKITTIKREGFEIVTQDNREKSQKERRQESKNRSCPVCGLFSFNPHDDLYMNKFQCCFECFIQYVDGREERWKTGWRPNR